MADEDSMHTPGGPEQHHESAMAQLRRRNRELVLAELAAGPATQRTLARATGLSSTTIRVLVADLTAEGIAQKQSRRQGSRGRPADWIALGTAALTTPPGVVAGVVCGHHTARVTVAADDGQMIAERQASLPTTYTAAACLQIVEQLVADAMGELEIESATLRRAVLGLPGMILPSGRVAGAGHRWEGDPAHMLSEILGVPTTVENDVMLAALGEASSGAAQGLSSVLYLKVGTGIGAALLLDGDLARGVRNFGSFLGHTRINPNGRKCKCGGTGCLETEASGSAATAHLAMTHPDWPPGRSLDLRQLMATSDPDLVAFRQRAGTLIGRTLADACGVLAPAVVIVAGLLVGPSDDDTLMAPLAEAAIAGMPRNYAREVRFMHSRMGRRAEPLGAAIAARKLETAEHCSMAGIRQPR